MDNDEVGVWLAIAHLAELHRQADQRRQSRPHPWPDRRPRRDRAPGSLLLADRPGQAAHRAGGGRVAAAAASGPGQASTEAAILIQHQHKPGVFDIGHCRACARQAGLLDHYDRVQREETRLRQTRALARAARRYAIWALCSSSAAVLLAAVALLNR